MTDEKRRLDETLARFRTRGYNFPLIPESPALEKRVRHLTEVLEKVEIPALRHELEAT